MKIYEFQICSPDESKQIYAKILDVELMSVNSRHILLCQLSELFWKCTQTASWISQHFFHELFVNNMRSCWHVWPKKNSPELFECGRYARFFFSYSISWRLLFRYFVDVIDMDIYSTRVYLSSSSFAYPTDNMSHFHRDSVSLCRFNLLAMLTFPCGKLRSGI